MYDETIDNIMKVIDGAFDCLIMGEDIDDCSIDTFFAIVEERLKFIQ